MTISAFDYLYEALKEVVDAADGNGWEDIDPSFNKQREALKAFEESFSIFTTTPTTNFDGYPLDEFVSALSVNDDCHWEIKEMVGKLSQCCGIRLKKNNDYWLVLRLEKVCYDYESEYKTPHKKSKQNS